MWHFADTLFWYQTRVRFNNSWFVFHESSWSFHETYFNRKQRISRIIDSEQTQNYGLYSCKSQIFWRCHNFKNITYDLQHHQFFRGTNVLYHRETIIYYFIYSGVRKVFRKIIQQKYFKETWFVLWYRSVSCREITVMCDTKYLNQYNKLRPFAKYFRKSFSKAI